METVLSDVREDMVKSMFGDLKSKFSGMGMSQHGPIEGFYYIRIDPSLSIELKQKIKSYISGFVSGWVRRGTDERK